MVDTQADEHTPNIIADEVDAEAEKLLMDAAITLKSEFDSRRKNYLNEERHIYQGFCERLFATWEAPINTIEIMLIISRELGSEIMVYLGAKKTISKKEGVKTRLHARAMQIASEILHLIRGGFAEGAMTRWRSLHETAVILTFISQGDEELATRYLDYQIVLSAKAATKYIKHHVELGLEPDDFEDVFIQYKSVISIYGEEFKKNNSWASSLIKGKMSTTQFSEIESFVNLGHLSPYYNFASQYTHANSDSIGYKLGLSLADDDEILLAGPSNAGLTDPIQCTGVSLLQINSVLVEGKEEIDWHVILKALSLMLESLKEETINAANELENKHKVFSKNHPASLD